MQPSTLRGSLLDSFCCTIHVDSSHTVVSAALLLLPRLSHLVIQCIVIRDGGNHFASEKVTDTPFYNTVRMTPDTGIHSMAVARRVCRNDDSQVWLHPLAAPSGCTLCIVILIASNLPLRTETNITTFLIVTRKMKFQSSF